MLENLTDLVKELKEKSYRPYPVKRVEIPKASGGVRKLGIPAVRDRVVQQALLDILIPILTHSFIRRVTGIDREKGATMP